MAQPHAEALPGEAPRLAQARVVGTDRPAAAAVIPVPAAAIDRHTHPLFEAVQHRQRVDIAAVQDGVNPLLPEAVVDCGQMSGPASGMCVSAIRPMSTKT
jgi:hypothetical protein